MLRRPDGTTDAGAIAAARAALATDPAALHAPTGLATRTLTSLELPAQLGHLLLREPNPLLVGEDGADPLAKRLLSSRGGLTLPGLPLLTELFGGYGAGPDLGLQLEPLGHAVPLSGHPFLPERLEAGDLGLGEAQLLLHPQEHLGRKPLLGTALHRGSVGSLGLRGRCGRPRLGWGPADRGLLGD